MIKFKLVLNGIKIKFNGTGINVEVQFNEVTVLY